LEISLGYQHRGVERKLVGGPNKRTLHYMETLAGDTTIGHATAYSQAVEALAGCVPSMRAQALRGIMAELERLACHTGDMGALADDVGFLPTSNYCGRIRGDFLNATGLICGNRFGRSMVRPGGVRFDVEPERIKTLVTRLTPAIRDVLGAVQLLWDSSSVTARFEETGTVSQETCLALGLVGMAARACGVEMDVRNDYPTGIYRFAKVPVSTWHTGDVYARAYVRAREIKHSGAFVLEQLAHLPEGELTAPVGPLASDSLVVSLTEGWRGEICHVAITNAEGKFAHYKIVDPSFHNWIGLAMSLRNQEISDFPLCNKSFNLSYCGHDL
jgi:Ni,Fe-hydrogenase III large subunit